MASTNHDRSFSRRVFGAALVAALCASAADALAEQLTNLVAIVTDDQGQWAVGAYGNRDVHTPNMDRIAREGATFINAFTATPVCSPSRAAYMSGQWPTQLGITDFISPLESAEEGIGLHAAIWPAALKAHGYATAMIGKWHLGTRPEFHPTRMGFDHFMGFLGGGNSPMNPTLEVEGREVRVEGALPDILVDDAIRFIRGNREQPFAVCLHFRAPHLPYGPVPEQDMAHYEGLDPEVPMLKGLDIADLKKTTIDYYASISSVDRNVGRLLDALDELDLAGNTLVMFTSDHGYNEGRHYVKTKGNAQWMAGGIMGPKRPNMWDTSMKVPLLVRWPGKITPGSKIEDVVSNLDMYRTVLGALDVPPPADAKALGVDYSPLLRGESMPKREALFAQYDLHNGGLAYMRMIRTDRYKYIKHFNAKGMDELYDLQADPGEERNIITRAMTRGTGGATPPSIVGELDRQLRAWQESIDDPVLRDSY